MLRALQTDIIIFLGFCVTIGVSWAICHQLFVWSGPAGTPTEDQLVVQKWLNRTAILVVLLAVLWLGWCIFLFIITNEVPRSDIDRGGVYDQMKSLLEKKH